jgi:hypothetical protein
MKTFIFSNPEKLRLYLLGIFICIMTSCQKDDIYPEISIEPLVAISNSSYIASAKVLDKGESKIVDHGFYFYFGTEIPDNSGYYSMNNKKSLGSSIDNDTFATVIRVPLIDYYYDNLKFIVLAYLTDERGTIYSKPVYKPILKVEVYSTVPNTARAGDTISISGSNFSTDLTSNVVTFNNKNAVVVSAETYLLKVIVPDNISVDYWDPWITIRVISGGQSFYLYDAFLIAPNPTGFSPKTGSWETNIKVTGTDLQNSTLYFNDTETSYTSRTSNQISANIPYNINNKSFKLYLKTNNVTVEVPGGSFRLNDLIVSLPDDLSYYAYENIYFDGSGFNPYSYNNKLYIGTTIVNAFDSYNQLGFTIPSKSVGQYSIMISNGVDTVGISQKLTITQQP